MGHPDAERLTDYDRPTIVEQAFFAAVGTFLAGRHYSIVNVRTTNGAPTPTGRRGEEVSSNRITVTGGPDEDVVRSGWKSVLKVLGTGAAAAEGPTKVTDLVTAPFGP